MKLCVFSLWRERVLLKSCLSALDKSTKRWIDGLGPELSGGDAITGPFVAVVFGGVEIWMPKSILTSSKKRFFFMSWGKWGWQDATFLSSRRWSISWWSSSFLAWLTWSCKLAAHTRCGRKASVWCSAFHLKSWKSAGRFFFFFFSFPTGCTSESHMGQLSRSLCSLSCSILAHHSFLSSLHISELSGEDFLFFFWRGGLRSAPPGASNSFSGRSRVIRCELPLSSGTANADF